MKSEDEQQEGRLKAFEQKELNLKDLAVERNGWETGKISRFFTESADPNADPKKQRERDSFDVQLSALEMMRQNAAYNAAYLETLSFLTDMAREAEAAIEALLQRRETLLEKRDAMLEAAPRLPVDRHIFRDDQGRVRDEHGAIIAELIADDIIWPNDARSYEEFEDLNDHLAQTSQKLEGWQDLRDNHIAPAREEIQDENNPASFGRFDAIQKDLERRADTLRSGDDHNLTNNRPEIHAVPTLNAPVI